MPDTCWGPPTPPKSLQESHQVSGAKATRCQLDVRGANQRRRQRSSYWTYPRSDGMRFMHKPAF
ncbi:hypothetical protein CSKR_201174 [Clonorchis sinensis]|uniref:Uncharacterized protein n=1 Tax=Clonorchis sinensis TaxID=79923 RepID=A0A8T1MNC6_CLOSI|nr:hypothetical protein CSKR_201174 [Clonorchis sinensis]